MRTTSTSAAYAGSTAADAIEIVLNAPQPIGPLPRSFALGLVSATGSLSHDGIAHAQPDTTTAFAGLGSGTLVGPGAPLAALNRSVTADPAHPHSSTSLGSLPPNPLAGGSLGPLAAAAQSLRTGSSSAELVDGRIGALSDLLPAQVLDGVDQALGQAVPAAQQAIDQALSGLAPVLGPIAQNDPSGTAAKLQAQLKALRDQLPALTQQLQSSAVVRLTGLSATQTVTRTATTVTSRAGVRLADLDVLGGLVQLTGFVSDATARTTGHRGGGTASAASTVASVKVGNGLVGVSLGDNGRLSADVAGLLPPQVVDQVDAALAQVTAALNGILDKAGVTITPAAVSKHVAADGRSAEASASGVLVAVQPPGTSAPLLQVRVGAADAKAASRFAVVERLRVERTELPHTGGGVGTPAALAAGAAVLVALAVRRRFLRG